MIDIDALKRDKRPQSSTLVHALIDRLEAAEKELAELRSSMKFRTSLIGRTEAERDALRAKIAEMERQAPVAWAATDETGTVVEALGMNQSRRFDSPLFLAAGAQPAPNAVAYLDLGVGGYVDIGTDLTDEELATLPKGRHMLGIVGTYGIDGYVPAQPTPRVPEGVSYIDTSQLEGVVSTEIVHSYPPPSGWLRAIDEALVVTHLGVANAHDTYEQAKAKLDNLIGFLVDVATDPAVNGGWKLVPIEPTQEMLDAGEDTFVPTYTGTPTSSPIAVYRAMLAAAPEANRAP